MYDHLTVFVVDDDEAVSASLEAGLTSIGLSVLRYSSGEAFLKAFAGQPGCLIVDVRMPEISGLDLQERLAKESSELAIILMSGDADEITTTRAMNNGAVGLLQKPFQFSDLRLCVEKALQQVA